MLSGDLHWAGWLVWPAAGVKEFKTASSSQGVIFMIMALVRTVVSLLKICPASYSATQNILCDVDFVLMKLSKNIWLFSFL